MKQYPFVRAVIRVVVQTVKILGFVAGGFLLYRNRKRLSAFFTRQSLLISALYAALIAMLALFYRLFTVLNWILQQGR